MMRRNPLTLGRLGGSRRAGSLVFLIYISFIIDLCFEVSYKKVIAAFLSPPGGSQPFLVSGKRGLERGRQQVE